MDTIKINSENTKIIAHRGLSGIEKENTCPAFIAAANRSYFGIETDIHVTADGQFVIFHDDTTKRVTLGKVNIEVEKCNYSELEKITLPDTDDSFIRQDIKIPLLRDYICICKKYGKIAVLEIKNLFLEDDIKKLVEQIRELNYLDGVIFISFQLDNCINLRKLLPSANIQYLLNDKITDRIIEKLLENKLDLDVKYTRLSKEIVQKLHYHGIMVNCWTCDNKKDAEDLVCMGLDYITTNILE